MTTQYSEAQFQKQVIALLTACGYLVIEVGKSRGKTKCPSCGKYHYSTGWQGNTVGAPDLYIHKKDWNGLAIGIELKTTKGAVRKEQQVLANNNIVTICRTLEDVVTAVTAVDKQLNLESKLEKLSWIM